MDKRLEFIIRAATDLIEENPDGWQGDVNDFVTASAGSLNEDENEYLTTQDVREWTASSTNAKDRLIKIKEKLGNRPTVSIHIRRGDYTLPRNKALNIIDARYYIKALDKFEPNDDYIFLVFSNDIEFAKTTLSGDNVWFVEPKGIDSNSYTSSEKEDLALLSLCDHHITTNSTYSWWGAYLSKNPDKYIVCPTNWLDKRMLPEAPWINGNHFPPNWVNIDNYNGPEIPGL